MLWPLQVLPHFGAKLMTSSWRHHHIHDKMGETILWSTKISERICGPPKTLSPTPPKKLETPYRRKLDERKLLLLPNFWRITHIAWSFVISPAVYCPPPPTCQGLVTSPQHFLLRLWERPQTTTNRVFLLVQCNVISLLIGRIYWPPKNSFTYHLDEGNQPCSSQKVKSRLIVKIIWILIFRNSSIILHFFSTINYLIGTKSCGYKMMRKVAEKCAIEQLLVPKTLRRERVRNN